MLNLRKLCVAKGLTVNIVVTFILSSYYQSSAYLDVYRVKNMFLTWVKTGMDIVLFCAVPVQG